MLILLTTLACSTPEPAPAPAPVPSEEGAVEAPDAPMAPNATEGSEGPATPDGTVPGDGVVFSGTIEGFGDGQVRFVEDGKSIHLDKVTGGTFRIEAPANNPTPIHVLVTAEDGSWAGHPDTVTLGEEDVSITFSSTDQPDWAANLTPPASQILTENDLDRPPVPAP